MRNFALRKDNIVKSVVDEEKVDILYQLEVERLKNFVDKWNGYFKELKEKYPLYPVAKKAIDIKDTLINKSCDNCKAKEIINEIDKKLTTSKKSNLKTKFDPKSKIKDYIAATSDNGFNMEEVLNPGALKLEDICKELGLIEEE